MNNFNLYYKEITPIFPQAKIYQPFGLNFLEDKVNISSGTYFNRTGEFFYNTVSPFNFDKVEYLEDNDLIVLHSEEFGFSLRLYFVSYKSITSDFWNALDLNSGIKNKIKICKSGKYLKGISTFVAYTEMYASSNDSILFQIFPEKNIKYSTDYLKSLFSLYNLDIEKSFENFEEIKKKESISMINSFLIKKFDSILQKEISFFSYNALLYI